MRIRFPLAALGMLLPSLTLLGACPKTGGAGYAVYKAQNCAMCHGPELNGTEAGPALKEIKTNWDEQKLSAYLRDPQGYAEQDERLKANHGKYPIPMPDFALSTEDEAALIELLLSR